MDFKRRFFNETGRLGPWLAAFLLLAALPATLAADGPVHPAPSLDVAKVAVPVTADVAAAPVAVPRKSVGGTWQEVGPAPIVNGQLENVQPNDEAVGAIHVVVAHPTSPSTLYVGAVNGGVWRTTNATAQPQNVKWKQLTDPQASLSIGALAFDPTDPASKTLVAGIGNYSSFGRLGGSRTGLLKTTDRGKNWTVIDGGLAGKNISGVAPRGKTIVVSVNIADSFTFGNIGIFRSTDNGATFTQISGAPGSGLPPGLSYDLVSDPKNPARLFTNADFADLVGGQNGIYRSDDTGATWTKVSDPAIDALLISGVTSNVEMAVGQHNNVYAAVVNNGRLAGVFRSGDGGNTWTAMGLPTTVEGGGVVFGIHPGGQGSIHMSIAADPTDPNIVYVGGDRQPFFSEGDPSVPTFFPNSIGANDFSGRLFRGDASQPLGSQWVHLTHSTALGAPGGGTASSSAPHADSREMTFNAAGDLIEVDDGGIYRRTSPRDNTGDWIALAGDIQVAEFHDLSIDVGAQVALGGLQDNGTPMQNLPGDPLWFLWVGGDGGDTAVESSSLPGISTRYTSAQFLGSFNRSFWDAGNNFLGFQFVGLNVVGGGSPISGQFATPIEINAVDPLRIVIGGGNSVYESFDQGDTLTEIGPGIVANGTGIDPIGYGASDNPDVLYIGSGEEVYVRTGPPPAPLVSSATFPAIGTGTSVRDISVDPEHGDTAYVTVRQGVFQTTDAGATWNDIGSTLVSTFAPVALRATAYITHVDGSGNSDDALVVSDFPGTVYIATEAGGFTNWQILGQELPTAPVLDLDYDASTDTLYAGSLGRGTFSLSNLAAVIDDLNN